MRLLAPDMAIKRGLYRAAVISVSVPESGGLNDHQQRLHGLSKLRLIWLIGSTLMRLLSFR